MDVDLLSDPGSEVRHVAVDSGSEHFTEAHAPPRRQAEQRPATASLLAHQRAAAVALETHTSHPGGFLREIKHLHTHTHTARYHAGVDRSRLVTCAQHPGSYGLHVEVRLTLGHGDDPDLPLLQFEGHWAHTHTHSESAV